MTATLKKRAPLWVWALIAVVVIAIAVFVTLEFTGTFIWMGAAANGFLGLYVWGSESLINATLLFIGPFALGVVAYFFWKNYVKGTKVPAGAIAAPAYQPQAGLSAPTLVQTPQNVTITTEDKKQ